jgi:hypothetical protein
MRLEIGRSVMAKSPVNDPDELSEAEAEDRFKRGVETAQAKASARRRGSERSRFREASALAEEPSDAQKAGKAFTLSD